MPRDRFRGQRAPHAPMESNPSLSMALDSTPKASSYTSAMPFRVTEISDQVRVCHEEIDKLPLQKKPWPGDYECFSLGRTRPYMLLRGALAYQNTELSVDALYIQILTNIKIHNYLSQKTRYFLDPGRDLLGSPGSCGVRLAATNCCGAAGRCQKAQKR